MLLWVICVILLFYEVVFVCRGVGELFNWKINFLEEKNFIYEDGNEFVEMFEIKFEIIIRVFDEKENIEDILFLEEIIIEFIFEVVKLFDFV